jgi:uncharacterized phage-associated protein
MLHRPKAPLIDVKPHRARIREAVVFLIETASRTGGPIRRHDLLRAVFLADRKHLNDYGRPITFDRYKATKSGPVATGVNELLKKDPVKAGLPWRRSVNGEAGAIMFDTALRPADDAVLSVSDRDALAQALTVIQSLGFAQLRKLTHEDPAYIDAWDDTDNTKKAFDMSYMMMFDVPDLQKAQELAFASRHI